MIKRVIVNDVGPRDGLQNQAKQLSVAARLELIAALEKAKLEHIEFGAFVSPKAVPAMAGAADLAAQLDLSKRQYSALIPNLTGYQMARDAGVKTVAMVAYGSDGMARSNVGRDAISVEAETADIAKCASQDGVQVITTITTCFECPFDGPTDADKVIELAGKLLENGTKLVVIADTIGAARPDQVHNMMDQLVSCYGAEQLGCHFHDTRALALANVYAALDAGIRRFDASIAGLGGCPFAPGATGNVATEDLVMMLEAMGYQTGVDQQLLMQASDLAEQLTGSAPGGRSKPWLKPYLSSANSPCH